MKLVECEAPYGDSTVRSFSPILDTLVEFENSGMKCAEVVGFKHSSTCAAAAAFYNSILRYKFKDIKVVQRGGNVFLVREGYEY